MTNDYFAVRPRRIMARQALLNRLLLAGSASTLLGFAGPVLAEERVRTMAFCNAEQCAGTIRGKALDDGSSGRIETGRNTELGSSGDDGGLPFSISVDGEELVSSGKASAGLGPASQIDAQRRTDRALSAVDIQVKFDGLEQRPLLNVSTYPIRGTYRVGEAVQFLATANYPGFIDRAEIRIFEEGEERQGQPVAVIFGPINGVAEWKMPADAPKDLSYVLRVYDSQGRFDETHPLTLARSDRDFTPSAEEAVAPGMGEDRTAIRNIPVSGGAVTVYGRNVPSGRSVEVFNEFIPVDDSGAFVVQRILPPGNHDVSVQVRGPDKSGGLSFSREVTIPQNDWFYVGLADLTVGKRTGDAGIEEARPGEYDKVYTNGRLAFYLKGKIKGEYLLTAAADTGEDKIQDLFKGMAAKDPRALLRRIDPDQYYPVYGDDSVSLEDAPTDGKFYVRLERGDSHVLWGNYKTRLDGTEFLRTERSLYGGSSVYRSEETTSFGERRTEVTAYAAQPDTLPQRDEFLATGGSAFFLKRQDIRIGSETVVVEIRDEVTGRVLERRTLAYGEDYTFDYMQGVMILRRPLSSSTAVSGPVRSGALGGNQVHVVVQYEYTPLAGDLDGYAFGGRAQHWLSDTVRVGVTGMTDKTGDADQKAQGVDVQLRHSETTFIEGEIARSEGPGFGVSRSMDGGLTISDEGPAGRRGHDAMAVRVRGQVDLADIVPDAEGRIGAHFENKEAGFATITEQTSVSRQTWGLYADTKFAESVEASAAYDELTDGNRQVRREGKGSIGFQLDEDWKLSLGTTHRELFSPNAIAAGKSGYNGSRLDAGARLEYRFDDDRLYYAFGQGTVHRSRDIDRNDRAGVGTEVKLTDKIGLAGEGSYGTHGIGGLAAVTYEPTIDDQYYFGYRLDPDRAFGMERTLELEGRDRGGIVAGVRRRIDDKVSTYAERKHDLFGRRQSLTETYGVTYTPDARWTVTAGFDAGRIHDTTIDPATGKERSDFDRHAGSFGINYEDKDKGISARLRGEARFEESQDGTRDRNTYLIGTGLGWKINEDGRLLTTLDAVLSEADTGSFHEGDYVESSVGYAYRPVYNDRLNALFKYIFLYDLPGVDQVSAVTGDEFGPLQRSHILSADFTYDLVPWLSVGGKYGFRTGEVRYRDTDQQKFAEWQRSSAHLGVARADLHIVKNWDVLLEGRVLHMPEADTTDLGFLTAIYRHVGDNFKLGVGYNFGVFSDDLRDLTLNDRGIFVNAVGKF